MEKEQFEHLLRAFKDRRPFNPFWVEFVSGGTIEVDQPESLALRGGVGVYISSQGDPTILDHDGVARIFEAP